MKHEMNGNLEVSQHLQEKLADEAEERRLECDIGGEISNICW